MAWIKVRPKPAQKEVVLAVNKENFPNLNITYGSGTTVIEKTDNYIRFNCQPIIQELTNNIITISLGSVDISKYRKIRFNLLTYITESTSTIAPVTNIQFNNRGISSITIQKDELQDVEIDLTSQTEDSILISLTFYYYTGRTRYQYTGKMMLNTVTLIS